MLPKAIESFPPALADGPKAVAKELALAAFPKAIELLPLALAAAVVLQVKSAKLQLIAALKQKTVFAV